MNAAAAKWIASTAAMLRRLFGTLRDIVTGSL